MSITYTYTTQINALRTDSNKKDDRYTLYNEIFSPTPIAFFYSMSTFGYESVFLSLTVTAKVFNLL